MSFDVFFCCLEAPEPWRIARADLRALFPVVETASQPDSWIIAYDSLNCCAFALTPLAGVGDLIASLHIERPGGDPRFWDALCRPLRRGPAVLFFPRATHRRRPGIGLRRWP